LICKKVTIPQFISIRHQAVLGIQKPMTSIDSNKGLSFLDLPNVG